MHKSFSLALLIAIIPGRQQLSETNPTGIIYDNAAPCKIFIKTDLPAFFKNDTAQKATATYDQNWLGLAQENIRKSEYNFKWEEKLKAYCTPNRKNNLLFFYDDKGFTVKPMVTKIITGDFDAIKAGGAARYKYIPHWKIKFELDKNQSGKGTWAVAANKAEYITDKITLQYTSNDEGMRQNFIVLKPLSQTDELKINFSIKTKLKTYLQGNQLQFFHKGNHVLNYDQLQVWDANGNSLEACIKKSGKNNFYINVNTSEAAWPVTIDPLSSTPDNTPDDANVAGADFGNSVASAGDVNGDGYSDVVIGARQYNDGANIFEGRAFVYYGSVAGLSSAPGRVLDDANQAASQFGNSVASAGDVNGDGYSDVIIGAYQYDDGNTDEGRVYIYHGSSGGLSASPVSILNYANQADAFFGFSVACAGDINGDGYSDVVIGAAEYDDGANTDEGRAYVHLGSSSGIANVANNTLDAINQVSGLFGCAVACAGDINGDGYSDVIIGARQVHDGANSFEGKAFVYHGSASGIAASPNSTLDDANLPSAGFGYSVSSAGDVNGDGYSDVIVGAWSFDDGANVAEGRVFFYHGSATGLPASPNSFAGDANQLLAFFGCSVACAGDINGDGYSDVIVGAFGYDDGANTNEGRAFVYLGSSAGIIAPAYTPDDADQANAQFGISVSGAGDVNGDGYSDVIIGANLYDDGANTNEGKAFVYHGSAAGLSVAPTNTPDDANQAGVAFGNSVACAGDVNGDGYSDVIIGAYAYNDGANTSEGRAFVYHGSATGLSTLPDNTPDDADQAGAGFGFCVASAGDVNGDGYSDVIIGAPFYDDGANTNEGRAFVYHGSATGLVATPGNTPDDANQINAGLGRSVASAGDVNGDGYSDVIVGVPYYDDGANIDEGWAFVYYGSATGLGSVPNNTPDDANQGMASFGRCVASAGDVNGDGYDDIIIGAYFYDDSGNTDEGRAFVYYGSAAGLSASPDNIRGDANQAFAYFGFSVACAGDVNGDGYSDVIIGAFLYDDGPNTDEGRAFVYYGSATGLSTSPVSTPDDADQPGAQFGVSVACAGDVNGDGYSDVVIGADLYDDGANVSEGRAFVYYGSATGLSLTPNSIPDDANQAGVFFGYSVACAGDINGDGYSDMIMGAYGYDDGANLSEGRAFIYNGNELTTNKRNNLRLYNTNLTTPLNSTNFIFGNFGAGLFAKSFLGRDSGKIVWETRLNYNAYSGTPITNSTFFTSQQSTYTDMGLVGIELKSLVTKLLGGRYTKLRARVKYKPLKAVTGQVYGPWRNVSSIIDANNLGILPIELISFNATWLQKGKTARLDFKTDKESGVCCFDIEKSSDGFNFFTIGTLQAKNITGIQSYSFMDANATEKNQFYRLKIKGNGGQFSYSNIQQLKNNMVREILVFPNPTTDVLQLQLNKPYNKMSVQVINSSGQMVTQLTITALNQTATIPVQQLPAGKYWLHLQSGDEKQLLQFVKQ